MLEAYLFSDLPCKSGSMLAALPVLDGTLETQALDSSAGLHLVTEATDALLDVLALGQVVQVRDGSAVREWRISDIADASGADTLTLTIEAQSLLLDLATGGFVRDITSGGQTWHNEGSVGLTVGQILDTFILQNLAADSLDWISRGTITPATEVHDVAFAPGTRLQWLQALVTATGGELQLRRNGVSGYYLDLLASGGIGSSATPIYLTIGRNATGIRRSRRVAEYASMLLPQGAVPAGGVEAAGIAYAAWLVGTISGTTIPLSDPEGGTGPVQWDDEYNGCYLLKTDGTLVQITDSVAATQSVVVSAATGITAGDHVEIRADSAGTYLTTLANPSATPRVCKSYDLSTLRGERNHVPNPSMATWPTKPSMAHGQIVSGTVSDTQALDGFPAGWVIPAGSWYKDMYTGAVHYVTTEATVAGDGTVTVVLEAAYTSTTDSHIHIVRPYLPTGWTRGSSMVRLGHIGRDAGGDIELTATATAVAANGYVAVSGFDADYAIAAGDALLNAAKTTLIGSVVGPCVADGAGAATLYIVALNAGVTNGDTLYLRRADTSAAVGVNVALLSDAGNGTANNYWISPSYTIRYDDTTPRIWGVVHVQVIDQRIGSHTMSASAGSDSYAVKLEVLNADTSAVLSSVIDGAAGATRTYSDPGFTVTLAVEVPLTTTTAVKLRVTPARSQSGATWGNPYTAVDYGAVYIGPDYAVPFTASSHANKIVQATHKKLATISAIPTTYEASLVDLSRIASVNLTAETLTLGGTFTADDDRLGVSRQDLRLSRIQTPGGREAVPSLTLDTLPSRLTSLVRRRTAGRAYITVDVGAASTTLDEGGAGGGAGTTVSATPDVRTVTVPTDSTQTAQPDQTGAWRSTPTPDLVGADSGVVPPAPYRKDRFYY